jgi:hypothetical protein
MLSPYADRSVSYLRLRPLKHRNIDSEEKGAQQHNPATLIFCALAC